MRLGIHAEVARAYLRAGRFGDLVRDAAGQLYSENVSVVIRKKMSIDAGKAKDEVHRIRPATSADMASLLGRTPQGDSDADDLWERRLRQHIVASIGIDRCLVADSGEVRPAFMQFLFTAVDNDILQSNFSGLFPVLAPDEALVEFLYVAPEARNPGLAIKSLVLVTEEAQRRGATSVISYIDPDNKGALFMNHLAGFAAQAVRRRKKRLFRSTYTLEEWPAGASRALNDIAGGKVRLS